MRERGRGVSACVLIVWLQNNLSYAVKRLGIDREIGREGRERNKLQEAGVEEGKERQRSERGGRKFSFNSANKSKKILRFFCRNKA